jgi:hypothetical protein
VVFLIFYLKTKRRGELFGDFEEQAQEDEASVPFEGQAKRKEKKGVAEGGDSAARGPAELSGLNRTSDYRL